MATSRHPLNYLALIWRLALVVAALGVITFIWSITISPIEFVRFERDRRRVRDVSSLVEILEKLERRSPQAFRGEPNVVYVSLPDDDSGCSHWQLPPLADGYVYRCAPFAGYRQANGAGWLPADLTVLPEESAFLLPIDPLNGRKTKDSASGRPVLHFYQYIQGSFSLAVSKIESGSAKGDLTEISRLNQSKKLANDLPPTAIGVLMDDNVFAIGELDNYVSALPKPEWQRLLENTKKELSFVIDQNVKSLKDQLPAEYKTAEKAVELKEAVTDLFMNRLFPENIPAPVSPQPLSLVISKGDILSVPPPLPLETKINSDFQKLNGLVNKEPADPTVISEDGLTFMEKAEQLREQFERERQGQEQRKLLIEQTCQIKGGEFDSERLCCKKPEAERTNI